MKVDPKFYRFPSVEQKMDLNNYIENKSHNFIGEGTKSSFKDVLVDVTQKFDKTMVLPDELMDRALTTGDVDIHEVMIANAKADIMINVGSQVVTKVVQAYERVQQIQL